MFNLKFSPELIFMLPLAVILDIAGLAVVCCGMDDFGIIDVVGMMFIFTWLLVRGKRLPSMSNKKGPMGMIRKLFTGKWSKFLTPAIGELTPVLGGIGFFWTALVFFTLTEPELVKPEE